MPLDRLFLGFLIIFIGCAGGLFWLLRKLWYTQQEIQTALSGAIADQISAGLQPWDQRVEPGQLVAILVAIDFLAVRNIGTDDS